MAAVSSEVDPRKQRLAEVTEKYGAHIATMGDRELLEDLERKALMASFGALDPTTAMMLKSAKSEILRRLKGGEGPKPIQEQKTAEPDPQRPTLFG